MMKTRRLVRAAFSPTALLYVGLGLLLALAALPATANMTIQSLDDIRHVVGEFVREQHPNEEVDLVINRLDPRLRLRECTEALDTFSPHSQHRPGHLTVGVRCHGTHPWTLYVPVRVVRHVEVLTLANSLTRGHVLQPEDVEVARRDVGTLPRGYFTDPADAVGMVLRRPANAGDLLTPNLINRPTLISRGDEIWLLIENDRISISAKGVALEDGTRGQRIRVRNTSSDREIEGEVIDRHQVRVAF